MPDVVDGAGRQLKFVKTYSREWQPLASQSLDPFLRTPLLQDFRDQWNKSLTVLDACSIGLEALIGEPIRAVENIVAEQGELSVVAGRDHDPAVAGLEYLVRHDRGMRRSPAARLLTPDQVVGADVCQRSNLG